MHIRLDRVSHVYPGTGESAAVEVLRGVSLDIDAGEFLVLRGASGSGKSTLLHLIGAVEKPVDGSIFFDGVDTAGLSDAKLTQLRRSSIGFIFQFFHLIPTFDVFENAAFPLELAGVGRKEIERRVSETLARVGLMPRIHHLPNQLSGGEMQRVAIARAIIHRPPLIIADEPTGNLDTVNGERVLELIREIHEEEGPTVVMATHSDRAAAIGRVVIEIEDGMLKGTV